MTKFDKAVDFYLRGFSSQYIKRRTGYTHQALLKELKSQGIIYSSEDIFDYQVKYIRSNYSVSDIRDAYAGLIVMMDDVRESDKSKIEVTSLGCGFGNYTRVFRELLGSDVLKQIHKEYGL